MNDAVITLNGLEKRFPGMDKPAVAPLDCTIHAGYVTGLVGPDGALLDRVERAYQGQALKVEFEQDDGRFIYEIRLLQRDGRLVKLKVDAVDGRVLKIKRKGP